MKQQKQSTSPVFEMILKSVGAEPTAVQATPSMVEVPENWHEQHQEGQLAVDVAQTEKEVMVVSTMAGAETDKIEVYLHNDLLTIRGLRASPLKGIEDDDYFHQECFWGKFSRTVVLPVDVKTELAQAEYKNGVLVIHIPKRETNAKIPVTVVEE